MLINLVYEQSALNAPAAFRQNMQTAANMIMAAFTDDITVNIQVGYGTIRGQTMGHQDGAVASATIMPITYPALLAAWKAHSFSWDDALAYTSLPIGTSIDRHAAFDLGWAQARALGLVNAKDLSMIDGYVGIGLHAGSTSSEQVAIDLHELTHAMGRINGTSLDLFRYDTATLTSSTHNHVYGYGETSVPAYFSADGGQHRLADFSTNSDPGDFANAGVQGGADGFNAYWNDTQGALTNIDLQVMDVLGFHRKFITTPHNFDGSLGDDILLQSGNQLFEWFMNGRSIIDTSVIGLRTTSGLETIASLPTGFSVLGTGDFNADGRSDFVLYNGQSFRFWLHDATGHVSESTTLRGALSTFRPVGIGDFWGDHKSEILVQRGSQLALWDPRNHSGNDGVVTIGRIPTLASGWTVAGVGDLNGDGTDDILLQNGQLLAIYAMAGDYVLPWGPYSGEIGNLDPGWSIVGLADVNGDHKADIVLQKGQTLAVWEMNGRAKLADSGVIETMNAGSSVVGFGDYNHDGRTDLLLQWGNTLSIEFLNGNHVISSNAFISDFANSFPI